MALAAKREDLNPTRLSLLNRLKNWEDQESWKQFFDSYWRLVYSVAIKAGLNQTDAEEVVQETFISVAKKMPDFNYNPEIGSFKAWLLQNTQWRIQDQFRKRKNQPQPRTLTRTRTGTATVERIPDPASLSLDRLCEEEWQKNLFLVAVDKVKGQVTAKQFQIFDLYVLKKWPAKKVSDTLGVTTGVIFLVKHRILQRVKKELKALEKVSI